MSTHLETNSSRRTRARRWATWKWCTAAVFAGLFFFYLFLARSGITGGDEGNYLLISANVVKHKTFKETNKHGELVVPKWSPGQVILDLPVALSFAKAFRAKLSSDLITYTRHALIVSMWSAFLTALQAIVLLLTCRALGFSRLVSVLTTIAFGTCTIMMVYSQQLLADNTLGLMWLTGFYAIIRLASSGRWQWSLLAGVSLGYSIITKPYAILTVVLFALYALWVIVRAIDSGVSAEDEQSSTRPTIIARMCQPLIARWRELLAFFLPLLLFGLLQLYYNYWRYGDVSQFGYAEDIRGGHPFSMPFFAGLFGLLFGSGKGIFWYNPVLILCLFSARGFFRRSPSHVVFIGLITSAFIAFFSCFLGWSGDYAWGPRYLVPILPFLILPLAYFFHHFIECHPARTPAVKIMSIVALSVLCLISFLIQCIGIIPNVNEYLVRVSRETKVFPYSNPDTETWPIQDEMIMIHFIPEFSPIAGHLWVIKAIRHRDREDIREVMQRPPWHRLNPDWVPNDWSNNPFHYNIWWLRGIQDKYPNRVEMVLTAFVFLGLGVLGLGMAIKNAIGIPK